MDVLFPGLPSLTKQNLFLVPIRKHWKSVDLSSFPAHKNGCENLSTWYSKGKPNKRKTWGRSRAFFLSVPTRSSSPFRILLVVSCRWLRRPEWGGGQVFSGLEPSPKVQTMISMLSNDATGMRRPQHPEAFSGSQLMYGHATQQK